MVADRIVHVVSPSSLERADQARACYSLGYHAEIYGNYEELVAARPFRGLVLAEDLPDRGGVAGLIALMAAEGFWLPVIATSAAADPHRVVEAIRSGALDYLDLPLERGRLLTALARAAEEGQALTGVQQLAVEARARLARLTARENEVLDLLAAGSSNKMIARHLQISPRTVEIHRANMMAKLDARHVADAIRLRLEAALGSGATAAPLPIRPAAL